MKDVLRRRPALLILFFVSFGLGALAIWLAIERSPYMVSAVVASLLAFGYALQKTGEHMRDS